MYLRIPLPAWVTYVFYVLFVLSLKQAGSATGHLERDPVRPVADFWDPGRYLEQEITQNKIDLPKEGDYQAKIENWEMTGIIKERDAPAGLPVIRAR